MKTVKQARATLARIHSLGERRFKGDYGACDALIDLARAIKGADLSERQREALHLVFVKELTQDEAGQRMGVTQEAVSQHISAALRKLIDAGGESDL